MRVYVYGKSKFPKHDSYDFVCWLARRLLGDDAEKYRFNLIYKKLNKPTRLQNVKSGIRLGITQGLCQGNRLVGMRVYVNETLSALRIRRTIAHEMVHCKQFIKGEINGNLRTWKWKKKLVLGEGFSPEDLSWRDYMSLPWEIEAFRREKSLVRAYNRERKKDGR